MQIMTIAQFLAGKPAPYPNKNTPDKPLFDTSNLDISQKLDGIFKKLDKIGDFLYWLSSPERVFMSLWHWTVQWSYLICLFVCLGSTLLYIFGHKKFAKWAPTSIAVYTLIQALGSAFK